MVPIDVDVLPSEQFVRLNEVRGDERRVDVTSVVFAEEVEEGKVDIRIHSGGEFTIDDARIIASYDM